MNDVDTATQQQILAAAHELGVINGEAQAAPRLLSALCQPDATAQSISRLIGSEPGLTARVLRVANSPFHGVTRAIATIDRAVVVLGLDAVRGIAAAACLDRSLSRGDPLLNMSQLLRHSVATAAAAEALARMSDRSLAPEAFMAGLLHDFGSVLMTRLDPQGMSTLLAEIHCKPDMRVRELEVRHMRVGHEICGSVLFDAWRLPDSLISATRHHHGPLDSPPEHRRLAALVHLAEYASVGCGMGFSAEPSQRDPDFEALAFLNLAPHQLDDVGQRLPQMVSQLQAALA